MSKFYNESNKEIIINLSEDKLIGVGCFGVVYRLNENECFKRFNSKEPRGANYEELVFIRNLNLKNFYKIYDFVFDNNDILKGYTMKYYNNEKIDILTMPTEYTLDNLYNIYSSVLKITDNNIYLNDMGEHNIIMDNNKITIIDADWYSFNTFESKKALLYSNIVELRYLFEEIYTNALEEYHDTYIDESSEFIISNLFKKINKFTGIENFCRKLERYKYPIDYIKKLSRRR